MVRICPNCGTENGQAVLACISCTTPLGASCIVCGYVSVVSARYCAGCGTALAAAPRHPPAAAAKGQPVDESGVQRRTLSILFCDLVGSAELSTRLDAETFRQLIRAYQDRATETAHAHEGFVARYMGDGILVYFGYPRAHEDDAERAVNAGLALLAAVAGLRIPGAGPVHLRVGIATGSVIVGDLIGDGASREISVIGESANLAARLLTIAEPDSIVVDERTRRMAGALFDWAELGRHGLKGFAQPVPAWRPLRRRNVGTRFAAIRGSRSLTPLVGRVGEIERLLEQSAHAANGRMEVAFIVGEPGIGKSRLLHEVSERLRARGTTVLTGHCTADDHQVVYAPFVDVLRRVLGVSTREDVAAIERRLRGRLASVDCDSPENARVLLNLFGLSAEAERREQEDPLVLGRRTRDLLIALMRALCRRTPTALFVEDLHWLDTGSEELLSELMTSRPELPLLVVGTTRPGYPVERIAAQALQIKLSPLSTQQTAQLVHRRFGEAAVPRDALDFILEKADGNPLFAEEIVELLKERKAPGEGAALLADGADPSTPDTIDKITMSRVDRLTHEVRGVLQIASVIGRRFSIDLLATVSTAGDGLSAIVQELVDRDLVFALPNQEGRYAFKHVLVRDAVYHSQLTSARRHCHLGIAEAIERQAGPHLPEVAEQLVTHYRFAGRDDRALPFLKMAGEKSLAVYALADAERQFRDAVGLIESSAVPDGHRLLGPILVPFMRVLEFAGAFADIQRLAKRHLPALEAAGESRELSLVLSHYAHALFHRREFRPSERFAQRGLAVAEAIGEAAAKAQAQLVLMKVYTATDFDPEPDIVPRLGREIIAVAEAVSDSYLVCATRFQLAIHRLYTGELAAARAAAHELSRQGEARNDARARGFALWLLGWVEFYEENYAAAMKCAEASVRAVMTQGDRLVGEGLKGAVLAVTGRAAEALAILLPIRDFCVVNDDHHLITAIDPPIGVAWLRAGRFGKGVRWLRNAIRERERAGYVTAAFYGHLVLGEVYVQIALRQNALSWTTLLRNLGFILTTAPLAARRAERCFRIAAANPRWGEHDAARIRIAIGEALLCRRRGDWERARQHLLAAHAAARAGGYAALLNKIDAALEAMPAPASLTQPVASR
jgi:class 3 adenylate cyclase